MQYVTAWFAEKMKVILLRERFSNIFFFGYKKKKKKKYRNWDVLHLRLSSIVSCSWFPVCYDGDAELSLCNPKPKFAIL